jgi:hypothetical protein
VICSLDTTSKLLFLAKGYMLRAHVPNSVGLLALIVCESGGRINLPVVANALCTCKAIFTSVNDFIIGN